MKFTLAVSNHLRDIMWPQTLDCDSPKLMHENLDFVCDISSHYVLPLQEF